MKAKKVMKRLDKVDELLSNVIGRFGENEPGTRDLLDSARKSVVRARATLKRRASAKADDNSPAKVNRKAPAVDGKVQSNGITRKRANVETAQAVSRTA